MKKDLFFTKDHEWIEYRGTVACSGVCELKLKGVEKIRRIKFGEIGVFREQGEVVATIKYDDVEILFCMPVKGRVMSINELLVSDNGLLLRYPEGDGWIAMIAPTQPYERKGLLFPKEFRMSGKGKYAK
jgi:glycine cleavage system H protein